jgi:eight-cysteine-cluster-containing protein
VEVCECSESRVWDGSTCKCVAEFCPIPTIYTPNGHIEAYCEDNECRTRTVCNEGYVLVQGEGCVKTPGFETIKQGVRVDEWDAEKPFDGKEEFVINDYDEWADFYFEAINVVCPQGVACLPPLPSVNFENETVIAILNKGLGYEGEITVYAISEVSGKYTVYATGISKCVEEGETPVGASYNPYVIVKTNKMNEAAVAFEYAEAIESCVEEFCGFSTDGQCSADAECITGGCSGQVCLSVHDELMATTCEYRECYNNELYGLTCGCVNNKCQWS